MWKGGVVQKKPVRRFSKKKSDGEMSEITCHNHEPENSHTLQRQILSNRLKRKAVDELCERPAKILHTEITSEELNTLNGYDVSLIRKNIHHARSAILPPRPKSFAELHVTLETFPLKTKLDENFLFINDSVNNIVGFTTPSNLKYLTNCEAMFVDGTFRSVPVLFQQLFVIHGFKNFSYVPLVFFLLPSKETSMYIKAFENLKNHTWKVPSTIYIDFEIAIHTAVLKVWPNMQVKGCRFHLGQAWYRKIQSLGLSNNYKVKDDEVGAFLRIFFGLPFLPPQEVEDCFVEDLMAIQPQHDGVVKFCDYIVENYIDTRSSFPPALWAEFSNSLTRTTNACESFHSKLNNMFYQAHPNIYVLTNALLEIQTSSYTKMKQFRQRMPKILETKLKFLSAVNEEFMTKSCDRFQFVKKISWKFLPISL